MCNCATSNGTYIRSNRQSVNLEDCDYTLEQIISWKDLLFCIKNNPIVDQKQVNKALGTVLSAIKINNPCYLQKELNNTLPLINQIIALNIC